MKKLLCGLGLLLGTGLLASCEKYLDLRTKGTIVPGETQNYRLLLNATSELENSASVPDVTSDDVALTDSAQQRALPAYLARAYTWQPYFYEATEDDLDWNVLYHTIYVANTVIEQVPASTGGTEAQKQALKAEALVHRAHAYLTLVNMYAKQYEASTAAADAGVPLLLAPSVKADLTRAPVQAVYTQLIQDLNDALPALPVPYTFNTQPTKAAAYALLARAYLQQGSYGLARQNAESALALKSTLLDLSTYASGTAYPSRLKDPEIILSKTANQNLSYAPAALRLHPSLLALLDTTDLRRQLFTVDAASVSADYTGRFFNKELLTSENRNTGPSVPEMLLIKAECQARLNDAGGAIATLNILRSKRFDASTYQPLTAGSTPALRLVLDERRRELFCRGLRWFDQKRLNREPALAQTQSRTWYGLGTVVPAGTYTLAPGGARYLFPIPPIPRRLNPELAPNPQ